MHTYLRPFLSSLTPDGNVSDAGLPLNTVFQGFSETSCSATAYFQLAEISSHPIHEPGFSSSFFVTCSFSVSSLKMRH